MKLRHFIATVAAVVAVTSSAAFAEQFAVEIDAPFDCATKALMETLHVSEVESFSAGGAHYVVLDAPGEAWVEAFFHAVGHRAITLNVVEADWLRPAMQALSLSERMEFLTPVPCEFCAG